MDECDIYSAAVSLGDEKPKQSYRKLQEHLTSEQVGKR